MRLDENNEPVIIEETYQPQKVVIKCDDVFIELNAGGFGKVIIDGNPVNVVSIRFEMSHKSGPSSTPPIITFEKYA